MEIFGLQLVLSVFLGSVLLANLSAGVTETNYHGINHLQFNQPVLHLWCNRTRTQFDPYQLISEHTRTFNEYVLVQTTADKTFFFLIFYHLEAQNVGNGTPMTRDEVDAYRQRQNQAKEYYWSFFNSSGVLPGLSFLNSTFEIPLTFETIPDDFIRYRFLAGRRSGSFGRLTEVPFDIVIEVPPSTKSYLAKKTYVEEYTWGYQRWRMSYDKLVTWEMIRDMDIGLPGLGTWRPEPEDFVILHNPCIPDLFLFSIITRSPFNDVNRVYLIPPLSNQTHWTNATSAFCTHSEGTTGDTDEECGSVTQLLQTNNHLLALSNLGLFVSIDLNSSVEQLKLRPDVLPVANFKLYNPCSEIQDILHCFDSKDGPKSELLFRMELFYTPVCHLYQTPNYRDMVILTIIHAAEASSVTGPYNSVTILYADAPYRKWNILMKSVDQYLGSSILDLPGIFFHHQLNQFDMVFGYSNPETKTPQYDRIILPVPNQKVAMGYYDNRNESFGTGARYKVYQFPISFIVSKVEVFTGSMDVFFLGNQLFIAESGSTLVYTSVANFDSNDNLDYCSFNHPDRSFVCINLAHTILLVGNVGSTYGMRDAIVSNINEVRRVAKIQRWIAPNPASSILPADSKTIEMYNLLNMPRLVEAFRHCHFTVSRGGTIQMWYMKGLELQVRTNYTVLPGLIKTVKRDDFDNIDTAIRKDYSGKILPPATPSPFELSLVNIFPKDVEFVSVELHGPLVPYFLDAITTILYEAILDLNTLTLPAFLNRYISQVNVGGLLFCRDKIKDKTGSIGRRLAACELRYRHIKYLQFRLDGFRSASYTFVEKSIPMTAIHCDFRVVLLNRSNNVRFEEIPSSNTTCDDCFRNEHMGWTVYIPGHFSVLLRRSGSFRNKTSTLLISECPSGIATRKANEEEVITVERYSSFFVDMSTPRYRENRAYIHEEQGLVSVNDTTSNTLASWFVRGGICLFELSLVRNTLLKSSGGHVIMDLQDSISFEVKLLATTPTAQVMLQRPLLVLSSSNPRLLHVDTNFRRLERYQIMEITVRPTGFGIGVTSLVVRSLVCSIRCLTPCSLTYIIQVTQAEGRALVIQYPTKGEIGADGKKIPVNQFKDIPINYRPPSSRGVDIPLSRNVYNVDPSKPRWPDKHQYRISNETGIYKKCLHQSSRDGCKCSANDEKSDDPIFSDCKRRAFLVKRAKETRMKISYPPLMDPSVQNPRFFLARQHLSIDVVEVNGRTEYSIKSDDDAYLKEINGDRDLNQGNRYYDADNLRITCYGTGLFHFKVGLGDFDSFGMVTGHFVLYSEERGLHDVTYLMVMFLTWTVCFILLFCGFIRVRKRLTSHLPIHGDTTKIKVE